MRDPQSSSGVFAPGRNLNFGDVAPEIVQLAINYASDYLDYMDNLPFDLQRSVTRLRELDMKCRGYVKEIEELYDSFIKENATSYKARRLNLLQIRRLFGFLKELGDEKMSIVESISEVIEGRNKKMEFECKRFVYAFEPDAKLENEKREKEKLDARGNKRSRRQRNHNSAENKEKLTSQREHEKSMYQCTDEPPTKILVSSPSNNEQPSIPIPVPALTRAALREEDKRASSRSKEKEDVKIDKNTDQSSPSVVAAKPSSDTVSVSTAASSTPASTSKSKSSSSNSSSAKSNGKKKKKRKLNKMHSDRHQSNSDDISPLLDLPIDPDEPTYCLCQQVSFGQMIGCDNPKCPIEWFHFSCVRLTHKPKGKWFCPDCTIKRKR